MSLLLRNAEFLTFEWWIRVSFNPETSCSGQRACIRY